MNAQRYTDDAQCEGEFQFSDEIAAVAELVTGKLGGRPLTVVRGLADRVLPPGEHGPGARRLIRETGTDMFGLGSRESVVAALSGAQQQAFGTPAATGDLVDALAACGYAATVTSPERVSTDAGPDDLRLRTLVFAFGWQVHESADRRTLLVPLS